MNRRYGALWKFSAFAAVMIVLTAALFLMFGQYRSGSGNTYTAVFTDVSRLKSGDTVRAAGIQVGTVRDIRLTAGEQVVVRFDADRNVPLTTATRAAVRYLNLTGDRYLELVDQPGSTRLLPEGSQIPVDRTAPALDLDLLLGGLKPVISSLNPEDVNGLSNALLQIFQDQGSSLDSLLSQSASFTTSVADKSEIIQQVIDNLHVVTERLAKHGDQFSGALADLEQLVSGLAGDRDTVASAIESLSAGTRSLAQLLGSTRQPLRGSLSQLDTLTSNLVADLPKIDDALQRAPGNYRRLQRLGSYGAWLNYYLCGVQVRVTDLQGRTAVFPWIKQETGRCADN